MRNAVIALLALTTACSGAALAQEEKPVRSEKHDLAAAKQQETSYAVVVKKATAEDPQWQKVVAALKDKHNASIITYEASVDESLDALKQDFPRHTCFVTKPEDAGGEFVAEVHQLTRKLDDDPYTDTFWGILTGYDADNALAIARHSEPLVVNKVASGTEFATEMVAAGQWYDELVKNKHVKKEPGGKAEELKGPDDTTKPLVDLLNDYKPDLMITSGHATQADWQIGYRFRSGQFRSEAGRMYGLDTRSTRFEIDSPNSKVYLPIGNCLMGDINGPDAMALAWMNDVGVKQMLGYTKPTWFGYMGWGVLDYFVEQPGRYTLTEAFFANHHALIHRLNDPATPKSDLRGLAFDRDVVAYYGDPKWSAKMAELPKHYDQALEIKDGVYTLTITPNRGEHSFEPVNTNGSQRGWRPIIQFLPHRIKDIEITAGEDLNPLVTDDFILVPNPRECDPDRKYVVRFQATKHFSEDLANTESSKLNEQETKLANAIFSSRLLEIAAEYKSYERVDQTMRWSPLLCLQRPSPPEHLASLSASDSEATHGRKLYFLYARKPWEYKGNVWGLARGNSKRDAVRAPLGQVLVKEAWEPVKADPAQAANANQKRAFAMDGDVMYHAGDKNGLFIMFKTMPGTPHTDQGWVYGTVSADGKQVTSVGLVQNCMQCHVDARYDRQIGLSSAASAARSSTETNVRIREDTPSK